MVKDVRQLRLDLDTMETSYLELDELSGSWTRPGSSSISSIECGVSSLSVVQLMGADGLAHSAGDSWQSAHLSLAECSGPDQCGRVRAVTEPLLRSFQLMHNGIIST